MLATLQLSFDRFEWTVLKQIGIFYDKWVLGSCGGERERRRERDHQRVSYVKAILLWGRDRFWVAHSEKVGVFPYRDFV